jgi:hypothetical protein
MIVTPLLLSLTKTLNLNPKPYPKKPWVTITNWYFKITVIFGLLYYCVQGVRQP